MDDSLFDQIQADAKYLNLDMTAQEVADLVMNQDITDEGIRAVILPRAEPRGPRTRDQSACSLSVLDENGFLR